MHDNGEGSLLFQHGVEGVHYKIENNEIVHIAPPRRSNIIPKAFIDPSLAFEQDLLYNYEVPYLTTSYLNLLKANGNQQSNMAASYTYTTISSEITELKAILDIMTGVPTVEQRLADYKTKAEELGLQKALDEMNFGK